MTDKIYILLPVHNRKDITYRFIFQLKDQTFRNFHLILIDDGSTDQTEEMVRRELPSCTIIKGKGDWWWAGSLQQGYNWLKTRLPHGNDIVLIINDDTYFRTDFLETGVKLVEKHSRTLIQAWCFYSRTNELNSSGVHINWGRLRFSQATAQDTIDCLSTRGLFLRLADFIEIGGFHPFLLPHYLSDYEFTIRAHKKGLRLKTDSALMIWMNEDSTGLTDFRNMSFGNFMKSFFSKKSLSNPIALTVFVVLACPWRWKLINLLRVWVFAFWHMFKIAFKVEPRLKLKTKIWINKLKQR